MYKQIERPNKESVINAFFSQVCSPVKVYLCLPSLECKDVVIGMQRGIIDKRTKIVAVERDYAIAHNMEMKLKSLGLKHEIHHCELEHAKIIDEIDLAYIDICGQITADILFWLVTLKFTQRAKVGFTFSKPARSHKTFYKRLLEMEPLANARLSNGGHCECSDEQIALCSAIVWVLPKIRFNLCRTYQDSRVPMIFLGGYFGREGLIKVSAPSRPDIQKVERRIMELSKEIVCHQQIGGFKIMWNRLMLGEKRCLRVKYGKKLKVLISSEEWRGLF